MLVGIISDTHGFFHPRVPELLAGVEHILHAGDIGDDSIIQELAKIAPITMVRGNNDRTGPTSLYPEEETLRLNGWNFFLTHVVKVPKRLDAPAMEIYRNAAVDIVVYGHSHIAHQQQLGEVLFFNPGAAGKRRFKVVPSIGLLELAEEGVVGTIIPL